MGEPSEGGTIKRGGGGGGRGGPEGGSMAPLRISHRNVDIPTYIE